nr:MAG TPA: hypothetical protein [Caudoviricetes sp.]DAV74856.1 MAG TPA: hypothetical protein [Caudoviricetes sp.]
MLLYDLTFHYSLFKVQIPFVVGYRSARIDFAFQICYTLDA